MSAKVASVMQTRPAKWQKINTSHGTFKGKIELKKYSREEYDSKSMVQHQQLYKLQKKARLIKGKKTPESSRALEARVAVLEVKAVNHSNECLFVGEKPKADKRDNSALDRKENGTRQRTLDGQGSQPSELRNSHLKPLSTIWITVAHASVASSKPEVELD